MERVLFGRQKILLQRTLAHVSVKSESSFMMQTETKESKWDMPEELQALIAKVGKDTPAPT
jgi:hypothetical protein